MLVFKMTSHCAQKRYTYVCKYLP